MAFPKNPLSLSVPDPVFETWLRDSGYLDILDHRTSLLPTLHSSTTTTTTTTTPTPPPPSTTSTAATTIRSAVYTLTMSLISSSSTLLSLASLNPFAKLTSSDFSTVGGSGWTHSGFIGSVETYSFPSSSTHARMRVHENVKRFATHYSLLALLFFCCSLYQMPLALLGLLSCLAVWELFRYCDARWELARFPSTRQVLIRAAQCAVAAILFWSNVQMAVFSTAVVSYAVLIMHAAFRKLTPAKQPPKGRGR